MPHLTRAQPESHTPRAPKRPAPACDVLRAEAHNSTPAAPRAGLAPRARLLPEQLMEPDAARALSGATPSAPHFQTPREAEHLTPNPLNQKPKWPPPRRAPRGNATLTRSLKKGPKT